MFKVYPKEFASVRMIVLAATLLLIPYSAFADGLGHDAAKPATQVAASHQADAAEDSASKLNNAPAEVPLHCHQKSPAPQATVLILEPVSPDHPPAAAANNPAPSTHTISLLNRCATRTPLAGPPRFILFGNFRS